MVITILSIFSTKTPYYPIQILAISSINAYLGISYIFNEKSKFNKYFKKMFFLVFPFFVINTFLYKHKPIISY